MIRLLPDQSGQIRRSAAVVFTFDGRAVTGHAGETVAMALLRAGHLHLRNAPRDGAPRGLFCAMGLCQECVLRINGRAQEACRVAVAEGLAVSSGASRDDL